MGKKSKRLRFTGSQGEELAGRLDLPDGDPKAYVLFAHCFTCSKDIFAASRISCELAARGFGVLRFDFTGLGASEGDFANTNFSSNIADLLAAAGHMRQELAAPSILIGHSLGGAAVLAAAGEIPEVRAVATIGAPFEAAHVVHNFGAKLDEIKTQGEAEVSLAGRKFRIKKQFLDDVQEHDMAQRIGSLQRALLVFHAPRDEVVGIENAAAIFKAAKHPKSFISLDHADHLLSRHEDAIFVARVLSTWAVRYLDGVDHDVDGSELTASFEQATNARPLEAGVVRASETGKGKFQQLMTVDEHKLLSDEPVTYGGMGSGPSPYDFLGMALASCTSMTLRMYAARKGLALEHVEVDVSHAKIHAKDCADCGPGREGRVDRFERRLTLIGNLSEAERQRLTEIADRCPVHQTLEKSSAIVTKLM